MNKWTKKSVEIANNHNYLDLLHRVYPVSINKKRHIPSNEKQEIKNAFAEKNNAELIRLLLEQDKFPIKDPYVAFLRKEDEFIDKNPETIRRLANRIYDIGLENTFDGIEEPKEFNRQVGSLFPYFINSLPYKFAESNEFPHIRGVAFLDESDAKKAEFAEDYLRCDELRKTPDLLFKVNDQYFFGEAKFLTDYGGHQNAQLEDALTVLRGEGGNVQRIAILDGVCWIKNPGAKMYRYVQKLEKPAFSALLLEEFIDKQLD